MNNLAFCSTFISFQSVNAHAKSKATCSTRLITKRAKPRALNRNIPIASTFTDDFFGGPSSPPSPRPLYQVALFSITTNLLWYGYYKYNIEEELRSETGHGLGGTLTLLPFVIGITCPLFIHDNNALAFGCALAGFAWILTMQIWLLKRVNALYIEKFGGRDVLTAWWGIVPGLNVIAGLRCIHYLAVIWGGSKTEDPFVNFFPFLGVDDLNVGKLVTTPSLWVSFGGKNT